jgi:hypothetical protein
MDEAALAHSLQSTTSPDDALTLLGAECGLPQYFSETAANYRARLSDKWNLWTNAGNETSIRDALYLAVPAQSTIHTIIPAGGHPEWSIPRYPSSAEHWSQFLVVIRLPADFVSDLVTHPPADLRSLLLNQPQLDSIRLCIRKLKPVDWVCREIVVIGPGATAPRYDAEGLEWDAASVEWVDEPAEIIERFPYVIV